MSIVTVIQTALLSVDSASVMLVRGTEYDSEHPLVKAHPQLFTTPAPEPKKAPTRRSRRA